MEKEGRFHIIAPKHLPSRRGGKGLGNNSFSGLLQGLLLDHAPCLPFLDPCKHSHMSCLSPVGLHSAHTEEGRDTQRRK